MVLFWRRGRDVEFPLSGLMRGGSPVGLKWRYPFTQGKSDTDSRMKNPPWHLWAQVHQRGLAIHARGGILQSRPTSSGTGLRFLLVRCSPDCALPSGMTVPFVPDTFIRLNHHSEHWKRTFQMAGYSSVLEIGRYGGNDCISRTMTFSL